MVAAWLSPLQALQSATLNPARFFDRTDDLGTVTEGKLADLVFLGANPLENITNTRSIRAVIANGHLFRRAGLDSILASVEAAVNLTSIATPVYDVLERDGIAAAKVRFQELRNAEPDTIRFGEYELLVLGAHLLGQGRVNQAIALLEMNIEFYPGIPEAFATLGDAFRVAGRLEDARSAYSSAVDLAVAQRDASLLIYRRRVIGCRAVAPSRLAFHSHL
jgi:tetratricopeptide (TPR) repeat protein